jgi:hypothetical protein
MSKEKPVNQIDVLNLFLGELRSHFSDGGISGRFGDGCEEGKRALLPLKREL